MVIALDNIPFLQNKKEFQQLLVAILVM